MVRLFQAENLKYKYKGWLNDNISWTCIRQKRKINTFCPLYPHTLSTFCVIGVSWTGSSWVDVHLLCLASNVCSFSTKRYFAYNLSISFDHKLFVE